MQHFIVPNQKLNTKKENKMEKTTAAKIVAGIVLFTIPILLGMLLAWPVMLLWNAYLVPALTIVKSITWLQAWGIMIMVSLFRPLKNN